MLDFSVKGICYFFSFLSALAAAVSYDHMLHKWHLLLVAEA